MEMARAAGFRESGISLGSVSLFSPVCMCRRQACVHCHALCTQLVDLQWHPAYAPHFDRKKHVMVAVRTSSLRMDSPVAEDGKVLVTDEYLDVLLRLANQKFVKNRERTDGFYALLIRDVSKSPPCQHACDSVTRGKHAVRAKHCIGWMFQTARVSHSSTVTHTCTCMHTCVHTYKGT
jgi:hypothetical protein